MTDLMHVWIFVGANAHFPSGVFGSPYRAEEWITRHRLTGTLTRYPVDIGIYEWAIENQHFTPKTEEQRSPAFIGRFTSATLEHWHYEDGSRG